MKISKLKKLYPNYLILKKKNSKLFYDNDFEFKDYKLLLKTNYIIVENESYEVHKKIRK